MISQSQSQSLFHPSGTPTVTDKEYKRSTRNFQDSVACLSWHKDENPNILACSAWDATLSVHYVTARNREVSTVENVYEGASRNFLTPFISLGWQSTERKLIAGNIDGSIHLIDLNDFPISDQIGKHDDAVKGVYYLEESRTICSLSYDRTMKFWDPRTQGQIISFNLGAKPVCSDMLFPNIAIGLSNEKLLIFDMIRDINAVFRERDNYYINSPLGSDSPMSALSISKENAIGIGNYDGRSNLSKFERRSDGTVSLNNIVTFKAHKIDPGQNGNTSRLKILYPIHAVGLHPLNRNTYFTAGGDGCVNFWDIPARNKLSFFTCTNTPITAAKYSSNGKLLAYAYGYDYAKGIEGERTIKPKLHIHSTQLDELARVE